MFNQKSKNGFSIKAHRGDAKTLLAFDLSKPNSKDFAGFTIKCQPKGKPSYFLLNNLKFQDPTGHAQDARQLANASINAPIQKFRWLHVPGSFHQGENPFYGQYTYTVTPRYFLNKKLQTLDDQLSVSLQISVSPFSKKQLDLGFTRGFVQSQAFVHHFGDNALFKPAKKELLFDTSKIAGKNNAGKSYTFLDEYKWSGFTAREKVFSMLNLVAKDKELFLDVFAYDLSEPDVMNSFLDLAKQGRIRIILDNASLHHDAAMTKDEDQFEKEFKKQAKSHAGILRGKFGRFAHDKVMIVYKKQKPQIVLTGSTNFSVTGMYVNSNHVLVFNNPDIAALYAHVFSESWNDNVSKTFNTSQWANKLHPFKANGIPKTNISFSPHKQAFADSNIKEIADRIKAEKSSVMFAVMGITNGGGDILKELKKIYTNQQIFSFGISDSPGGISLHKPGRKNGILITGKTAKSILPSPFDKEVSIGSAHQIHHKFVVCGFNTKNPVVYCGSSNLASGGEAANGDNLLGIYDEDIATVFAIEALGLVDHFHFRNQFQSKNPKPMILHEDDKWVPKYYDSADLYCVDRELFR
jgi:hypothetical protein